jgi:hypothetical protein
MPRWQVHTETERQLATQRVWTLIPLDDIDSCL